MAYVRPLVQVFQEYESFSGTAQDTVLNPCIIGPCYQFVDQSSNLEEDLEMSYLGDLTDGGLTETVLPNIHTGAVLDEDSVKVRVVDPFVDMGGSEIDVDDIADNKITFTALNFPTNIALGDYLTIISNDGGTEVVADTFLVIAVDTGEYEVTLNRVVPAATAPTAVWLRMVSEFTLPASDSAVTVDIDAPSVQLSAITQDVDETPKTVYSGRVYCGFLALRQDVDKHQTADNVDSLEGLIGKPVPENPLAYGAMIALANSRGTVHFVGVDSDDLAGYTAAKDVLENAENIYSLVPLTRDPAVLSMFKVHAEAYSQPQVGQWRIVFGNSELPSVVMLSEGTCKVQEDSSTDLKVLYAEGSTFMDDGVNVGDTVTLANNAGGTAEYIVSSVVSEDMLIVSEVITGVTADTVGYTFSIETVPDKTQQAQAIAKVSASYASHRFYHVWPDVVYIDGVAQPGYYQCCALAGMVSSLPSHQGLTRISIAGISAIKNSGDYFNSAQLDIIAGGGTFILTQLTPNAPPFIRHQLSTDTSEYAMRELSFVKNFDYVSYICKDVLDGFVGRYNVTPTTLGTLETVVTSVLESLKLTSLPRIGSPVLNYQKPIVQQLEAQRDRVEIQCRVEFPYVLNMIGMHLISADL